MEENLPKSRTHFNNLLNDVLLWLTSHRSYGIKPSKEEYMFWNGKLTLARRIVQDYLQEDEKERGTS